MINFSGFTYQMKIPSVNIFGDFRIVRNLYGEVSILSISSFSNIGNTFFILNLQDFDL